MITTHKTVVPPFTSSLINTKARGPELNAFRPTSDINVLTEGNANICSRLFIEVVPSINLITHQDCSQKVQVYNSSSTPKTIAKGVTLANCCSNFDEYEFEDDTVSVNFISTDPV